MIWWEFSEIIYYKHQAVYQDTLRFGGKPSILGRKRLLLLLTIREKGEELVSVCDKHTGWGINLASLPFSCSGLLPGSFIDQTEKEVSYTLFSSHSRKQIDEIVGLQDQMEESCHIKWFNLWATASSSTKQGKKVKKYLLSRHDKIKQNSRCRVCSTFLGIKQALHAQI